MTKVIQQIKRVVKSLPCLCILDPNVNLIEEIDASNFGYGGILKQVLPNSSKEQVVKYHSEGIPPNLSTLLSRKKFCQ